MKPSYQPKVPTGSAVQPLPIDRRRFLQTASAGLALSALGTHGAELRDQRSRRVGLIGAGWYGKSDLWRLIQVAPVEVVSICDPDKQLLAGAVEVASQRQK
jgi:ornithine cyclodeaminase/alanine dehydrogenase-like protein (mu-crystallin family)